MKVKSESEITQLCPTLSDPMDCSLPGSSIHGIFQARVLEWVAIACSNAAEAQHHLKPAFPQGVTVQSENSNRVTVQCVQEKKTTNPCVL